MVNINNAGAGVFKMLAATKSYENICFSDQHYQPAKMNSQVSVLMVQYLVAVSYELELWMV